MPIHLDDGHWYQVEAHRESNEPCVVLQLADLDVWLSPQEARGLAAALLDTAGVVTGLERVA